MKKLGLVLGGGAAYGYSHIGVIKKLEENNIRPDFIVGCSMGALIASLYCTGTDINFIEKIALNLNFSLLADFSADPRKYLLNGDNFLQAMRLLTGNKNFSETTIPLYINAVTHDNAEGKLFKSGNIAEAVRASASLPWIFRPAEIDGVKYVDGGVSDSIPVEYAKGIGADIILAVGFRTLNDSKKDKNSFEKLGKSIETNKNVITGIYKYLGIKDDSSLSEIYSTIEHSISILTTNSKSQSHKLADIFISPDLTGIKQLDFRNPEKIIKAGYIETEKHILEILEKTKNDKIVK